VALTYVDETVSPVLKVSADNAKLKLGLQMDGDKLNIDGAAFAMDNVAMNSGALAPLKLSRIGFDEASLDLAARKASVGRLYADGGQLDLSRDAKGQFLFIGIALPGQRAARRPGQGRRPRARQRRRGQRQVGRAEQVWRAV
jgi:hypothetical protein